MDFMDFPSGSLLIILIIRVYFTFRLKIFKSLNPCLLYYLTFKIFKSLNPCFYYIIVLNFKLYFVAFFLLATVFFLPLRVRALFLVL